MQAAVVRQAAGSAYGEFGGTKVIAAVYGPKQGPRGFSEEGALECEVTRARFRGRGSTAETGAAKDAAREAREARPGAFFFVGTLMGGRYKRVY